MALLLAIGMSAADVARLNDETRPEVLGSWSSSKYDAKNNRCYVRIYEHTRRKSFDLEVHQVQPAGEEVPMSRIKFWYFA
jgi:hypothetical protein